MTRFLSFRICAALIAMALVPAGALAQPAPQPDPGSVSMTAAENREVVLSLADVMRERFAFEERGAAAAQHLPARGDGLRRLDGAQLPLRGGA